MAIMRQSLNFGGINSADFGIYISGEGVFNAPKRAVEFVSVPGRNGALAIDQGYYENITVTYPAFNAEDNLEDFKRNLAAFRNALCSQKGYQRLIDSFHQTEYRMALFAGGLEINPIEYNTAAKFEMKFDCYPQRFLVSGETSVSLESGADLINPTLYEASPLLAVEGYGTIGFNGYNIQLANALIGDTDLFKQSISEQLPKTYSFNNGAYNDGDAITVTGAIVTHEIGETYGTWNIVRIETESGITGATTSAEIQGSGKGLVNAITTMPELSFVAGTNSTLTHSVEAYGIISEYPAMLFENHYDIEIAYTAGETQDSITVSITNTYQLHTVARYDYISGASGSVNSSLTALGNPTYIDCELGECYMMQNGSIFGLNAYIDLGSNLPVLASGDNTVTYDNTITSLEITPRWWQL